MAVLHLSMVVLLYCLDGCVSHCTTPHQAAVQHRPSHCISLQNALLKRFKLFERSNTTPTNCTSRQATALANRHWSALNSSTSTNLYSNSYSNSKEEVRRLLLSADAVSEQTLQQKYCFHMGFQCSRVCTETTSSDNNVAVGRRRNPTKPKAEYCFCMGFRCYRFCKTSASTDCNFCTVLL